MITRIDLRRFKCFETLRLPLHRLTLLSGLNAAGKSSVIQALVLLHQTMREHEWSKRLMLNGNVLRLGAVRDVIDQVIGGQEFSLAIEDDKAGLIEWKFSEEKGAMSMMVLSVRANVPKEETWQSNDTSPLHYLLPEVLSNRAEGRSLTRRLRGLTWLSAERLGPRDTYALDDPELVPLVSRAGENAASVLYSRMDDEIRIPLRMQESPPTVLRQVEARMGEFFPGFELDLSPVSRANAVTLGVRTSRDTEFHRPGHTGFGITQVLPIVVAILSASPDDLLLIENPGVHLHPAGQSRMGEFLAEAASSGLQIIIESHSDHVLNGIRRAVRNGKLDAGDAALYFFRPRRKAETSSAPQVESLTIDAEGNIDNWPPGFFDQFDRDMNYLAGWS